MYCTFCSNAYSYDVCNLFTLRSVHLIMDLIYICSVHASTSMTFIPQLEEREFFSNQQKQVIVSPLLVGEKPFKMRGWTRLVTWLCQQGSVLRVSRVVAQLRLDEGPGSSPLSSQDSALDSVTGVASPCESVVVLAWERNGSFLFLFLFLGFVHFVGENSTYMVKQAQQKHQHLNKNTQTIKGLTTICARPNHDSMTDWQILQEVM